MEETLVPFIPNLSLFFTMFITIYLTGHFIVFRNWSTKQRPEAASCFISLFHGTPAVFLAAYGIFSDPNCSFASPNTQTQNMVMDYSVAYFLTDLIHYFIFNPSDVLFIIHHLATLSAYFMCRYIALHGAYTILVLLAMAEITSFCQNVWTLANTRKADNEFAAKVYDVLAPPFYAFYSVVRGFAGPMFAYQMGVNFFGGVVDGVIPKWVWGSWFFLTVMFIPVSLLWISNLWIVLYRERTSKIDKKLE